MLEKFLIEKVKKKELKTDGQTIKWSQYRIFPKLIEMRLKEHTRPVVSYALSIYKKL